MDDEAKKLLQEILNQQTKQTELLQKHLPPLWRKIRFSLLALLILMTLVAIGLGFGIVAIRSLNRPSPAPSYQQKTPDDIFGSNLPRGFGGEETGPRGMGGGRFSVPTGTDSRPQKKMMQTPSN